MVERKFARISKGACIANLSRGDVEIGTFRKRCVLRYVHMYIMYIEVLMMVIHI